jgi:hypothetical protein
VGVWDLMSEKVCWAGAITYVIHFEPVYCRVNCHSLLFVVLCAFHGFFIHVKIFYHVHMIVPFPVMCTICSIRSIACPASRNCWENVELLLQLWQEWICSLSYLLHVQYEGTDGEKMELLLQLWKEWACLLNLVKTEHPVWPTYIYRINFK